MNTSSFPQKTIDKNYLFRLLNGNNEMISTVLNEIFQNIPNSLNEINSSIRKNDYLGVITFAPRVKSAFTMLGETQLVNTFQAIETAARKGEMSSVKELFEAVFEESMMKIHLIQELE